MKVLFAVISLLLTNGIFAGIPDSVHVYHWEELPDSVPPETVVALSFHRMKLDSLPHELAEFENLQYLIVSRNRLSALPTFLSEMQALTYLDLSLNRFKTLPAEVCSLTKLTDLILNRNSISTLPTCIGQVFHLRYIDLWDNPVRSLPESLVDLSELQKIDLSGIKFAPTFQEKWYGLMPRVNFVFEEPCNCME